jgi:hypothetical protein
VNTSPEQNKGLNSTHDGTQKSVETSTSDSSQAKISPSTNDSVESSPFNQMKEAIEQEVLLLEDLFATPVEGWSYNLAARIFVSTLILALFASFIYVALKNPTSASMLLQMAALGAVVLLTGQQIVFGKTRIDKTGLHRSSFYKPKLNWYEVNHVRLQGLYFAPRLAVSSMTGPVRFHAGTPELLEAFNKIVLHFRSRSGPGN